MNKQNSFTIKVAGFVFEVRPVSRIMYESCVGYYSEEEPECVITVTQEELEYERKLTEIAAAKEKRPDIETTDVMLERCVIHRMISDYVSQHQGAMFHGALIEKDGRGYLFAAKSGTGKTTHIRNWQKVFDDVTVVNGDKPILRLTEDGIYGYGTPWCGKERLNSNTSVKLENLIILERSDENSIERANYKDYMNQLFTQIYIPKDSEGMGRAFEMIHHLSQHVRLYRLGCNMDPQSAVTAYEGMRE